MIPAEELIDSADQSSIELGPGAIIDLNPGEEVQFADPKHPNTGYDDFTNATIRLIGAGLEIPPEVMMKQFTTSYSAARGALNEFWRTCSMQRDWFTDDFCQPVYEEWFAEAVARGRIHAPGFFTDPARRKAYTACAWNGPARTNLNPVQEVDAAIKRVDAGFSTAQEETAQMTGGDYNRNIKLRVTEAKRKREVDEIGKSADGGRIGGKQKCPKTRNSGNSAIRAGNKVELLLYGDISQTSWWGDEVTPKQFAEELAGLGALDEITVRINSGGGDVFAAQAIGNQLEQHPAAVTAKIDGLCASAATIVACHCGKVIAANDSTFTWCIRCAWALTATITPRNCRSTSRR